MNWNYISGFFDADGSVSISKVHKNGLRTPVISFHNTKLNILEDIQQFILIEINIKGFISIKPAKKDTHTTSYDLKYVYFPKCLALIDNISSIHPKKIYRFNIIKEMFKYTHRQGKYTMEMLNKREELEKLFFTP